MKKVSEEITNNVTYVQYFYTTVEERKLHIEDMQEQGYTVEEKYYDADNDNNKTYVCCFSKTNEIEQNELLQGLINYIETLKDGGTINLISFVEEEGIEVTRRVINFFI